MENKTSKYFKYAIGEIILVVIGILIALSINNWNEASKLKKTEFQLLTSLSNDLDNDIQLIEKAINFESQVVKSSAHILEVLNDTKTVYHDSLSNEFGFALRSAGFMPQKLTYESIKSVGFNIISNIEVRSEIIKLYDIYFENSNASDDFAGNIFIKVSKVYDQYFYTGQTVFEKIPNNFEVLKTNTEFKNTISAMLAEKTALLDFRKNLKNKISNLKDIINEEVKDSF